MGIEDELGLEESVIVGLGQETKIQSQVEIWQTLVQKPAFYLGRQTPHGLDGECTENNCILHFHSRKEGYKNINTYPIEMKYFIFYILYFIYWGN
jgi:hypothetical protein